MFKLCDLNGWKCYMHIQYMHISTMHIQSCYHNLKSAAAENEPFISKGQTKGGQLGCETKSWRVLVQETLTDVISGLGGK